MYFEVLGALLSGMKMRLSLLYNLRRPGLVIVKKREQICLIMDFTVPADHRVKLKESRGGASTKTLQEN